MNLDHYAAAAEAHMRINLADRYSQIENPESYFRGLGEQIAAQVAQLESAAGGVGASLRGLSDPGGPTDLGEGSGGGDRLRGSGVPAGRGADRARHPGPTDERGRPADDATRDGSGPGGLAEELWHLGLDPASGEPLWSDEEIESKASRAESLRTTRRSPIPPNPGRPSPTLPSPRGSDGNS